jgi:hypothetical protein
MLKDRGSSAAYPIFAKAFSGDGVSPTMILDVERKNAREVEG